MKPDQVLVLTTQWRADAVAALETALCAVPELVPLARVSTRYRQAVTPHPFGPFARAAVLTGQPSPRNGVRNYEDPLPGDALTLPRRLGALGYQTGWFGKWHLARRDSLAPLVGETHARQVVPAAERGGFDYWEGFEGGFLLNDPWLQGGDVGPPTRFPGYQSDVVVERALRWWRSTSGGAPRLLVVSLEAPHPPYDATCPFTGDVTFDLPANVPRGGAIEQKARRELAGYVRHVRATAAAIARLWDGLGEARERVHFTFTSVHGDQHGSQGLFRKGWPFEESVRVPLWVHRPGQTQGWDDEGTCSLLDLAAAAEAAAQGQYPVSGDRPVLISMPSVVRLPWQCAYVWRGLRSRTRKYVEDADGRTLFFFDLENDPGEERNLAFSSAWANEVAAWRHRLAQEATGLV